jgi:very-short-patch-repair endonuclease
VDFVCLEAGLVVELDGGQHLEQLQRDEIRTKFLEKEGFRVIRFWDDDVLLRTTDVLEEVLRHLSAPHPNPLPARGERG